MTRKSEREIERLIDQLREEVTPDPEFNITSEVTVIMDREDAEDAGREILDDAGETTRIVTWYDENGNAVGGSPEQRVSSGADLVEVEPLDDTDR
jgi:hypothetical protein